MSNLTTLPKGDSAWLLRKSIQRIMQQVSVLETNIGSSTTGNSSNNQVIFNDDGTLRGDSGLTFNKTTDTLQTGALVVPGNVQLATVSTLYVGSLLNPKLKVDVGGTGVTTITEATITGDLTVDTSTLKVDSTNDRVGIGTVTPAVKLTVRTSHAVATATTYTGGFLIHDEVNGIAPHLNAGIAYDGGNQHSWIQSNDTTGVYPLALNPAGGDVRIGANLVMLTAGKGIDFSATTSGSGTMTSELLNDYEEGTFTPTVGDASSGGNQATTATAVGRYTKIGRLVTVQWEVTDINTTGLTAGNAVYIRGLPFASSSATTQFGTTVVTGVTFSGYLSPGIFNGSSFPIYSSSSGGSLADIKVSALASGTADIWGTLTYIV